MVDRYIPGFTNMLMRPDLFDSGPAYVDMMPGAMPEQVSMLPFAPEAPAPSMPQPSMPQPSMPQPSGLGGRQNFMDERDIFMGDAPDRFSRADAASNTLANALQRDPVTGLLLNAQGQQGFQFMTDRGNRAGFGKGNTGFITADPNAQYRMWDERGKNRVVVEGTGVDALRNIYNTANQFNTEQGKKANWGIERLNPTTGRWERVAENDPSKNILGKVIGGALPLAALAIPGFGKLALAAKLGIGAGLGGVGAGIAGNDPLKGALMGGLSMAGGQVLGPALGKGLNIGSQAAGAIGTGIGATTGGLATGQSLEDALKGGALSGVASFGAGKVFNALNTSPTPSGGGAGGGDITVTAPRIASLPVSTPSSNRPEAPPQTDVDGGVIEVGGQRFNVVTGAAPMFGAGIPAVIPQGVPTTPEELARKQAEDQENEIIVPGDRITNMAGGTPSFGTVPVTPSLFGNLPPAMPEATPNEIVVTNKPDVPSIPVAAPLPYTPTVTSPLDTGITVTADRSKPFDMSAPLPPLSAVPTTAGGEFGNKQVVEEEKKGVLDQLKDRLGNLDAADYLRLAGVLLPLLDGGGGGRRGALSTIPSGMFGRSSVFGGSLPRATLPGASTGFAPRAPSALGPQTTQDYYRYGYGPAQSFFDYVPQGQPNTSRAFTGYEQAQAREDQGFYLGGMAGGGDMAVRPRNSFAVNGPGSGRSDDIPAMLSDGEYVMDAETVALLGDGSPQEGADRLDKFRKNVRQHKARKLAKGEFSDNAKRPEHYLKGGRT